ncbi:hypothetical protein V8B97DRAFT_1913685 [Scleroderma yunnanense]
MSPTLNGQSNSLPCEPREQRRMIPTHTPTSSDSSHGVDRIPFPSSVKVHTLDNVHLEKIIREHVARISKLGRRMVELPIVLVRSTTNLTVFSESEMKTSVYSSEGDRHSRLAPSGLYASWKLKYSGVPLNHDLDNITDVGPTGSSVEDAIVIDPGVNEGESISTRWSECRGEQCGSDPLSEDQCLTSSSLTEGTSQAMAHVLHREDDSAFSSDLAAPSDKDIIIISSDPEDSTFEDEVSNEASNADDGKLTENDSPRTKRSRENDRTHSSRTRFALPSTDTNQDALECSKQHQGQPSAPFAKPPSTRRLSRRSQARESAPERRQTTADAENNPDAHVSQPQPKRIPLPRTQYGRSRRIATPATIDLPLVAVTMRGDCHFIHKKEKHRITRLSPPNTNTFRHVEDVCIVDDTVVLGCDKGSHQISFLPISAPHIINARHSPHSHLRHQGMTMRGVSCLAAMHAEAGHIKFVSGGHDGFIHIWTANIQALDGARSEKVAFHGCNISALAYGHHNATLLSSAQKTMVVTDLNRMTHVTNRFSNEIQQIHVHPQAPYMTLFEEGLKVRHLDRQILLYDSRKSTFDKAPCLSFGQRSPEAKFSPSYTRGSTHLVYFARGSEDGAVLLWDFRNTKIPPFKGIAVKRHYQQAEKVVHTVFVDSDIVTLGDGVVTFFERYLAA